MSNINLVSKFEIFIEDGLPEDNPYRDDIYGNCVVCDKPIKCGDTSFMIRQAVEVTTPAHFGLPPDNADGTRTITKDPQIGPIIGVVCSLNCADFWILQNI